MSQRAAGLSVIKKAEGIHVHVLVCKDHDKVFFVVVLASFSCVSVQVKIFCFPLRENLCATHKKQRKELEMIITCSFHVSWIVPDHLLCMHTNMTKRVWGCQLLEQLQPFRTSQMISGMKAQRVACLSTNNRVKDWWIQNKTFRISSVVHVH